MEVERPCGARERNGQELLRLHKQERGRAALGSVGAIEIAASYGEGRPRCAAAGQQPEDRLNDPLGFSNAWWCWLCYEKRGTSCRRTAQERAGVVEVAIAD